MEDRCVATSVRSGRTSPGTSLMVPEGKRKSVTSGRIQGVLLRGVSVCIVTPSINAIRQQPLHNLAARSCKRRPSRMEPNGQP